MHSGFKPFVFYFGISTVRDLGIFFAKCFSHSVMCKEKKNTWRNCPCGLFPRLITVVWLHKAVGGEFDDTTGLFTERNYLRIEGGGMM